MNEEEWQFFVVIAGVGIIAAAVIINDLFSLQKFWFRWTRSQKPPTREMIAKAYMRHQRFYHHTDQRLFSTTYVSFYLFALSFWGILFFNAFILMQDILNNMDYNTDGRLLRLFYITFFFVLSRWYYRQEHHYTTTHKLVTILSCLIIVDLVHLITGAGHIEVATILLIFWIWMMGMLGAVLSYEVNYARDIAFSIGIPFAIIYYLIRQDALVIVLVFGAPLVLAIREFVTKSEEYNLVNHFFPNPLPFRPVQPRSFIKDVLYSLLPREIFAHCSVWEVLFWFCMTPVVLVPVVHYLQGREEQLQKWYDDLVTWSQNEYVLDPETVADRLGLMLVDTYPLLNELTDGEKLTLYESPEGLLYGLPPSEEMEAFITRRNLRKAELPEKDRDLIEYLWEKIRTKPPKTILLSVIGNQGIEVSYEPAGGTISALKSTIILDTYTDFTKATQSMNRFVDETFWALCNVTKGALKNQDKFVDHLENMGRTLLKSSLPRELIEGLEMPHILLETNMDDTPFELMYDDKFFALKYAIGRRLRVTGSTHVRARMDIGKPRALIIGDPQGKLEKALTECDYLNRELSRLLETHYLPQEKATWKTVTTCLIEGYSIIHYAGHADEKGLHLQDEILDTNTVATLLWGNPLVFINGCYSARTHTKLAEAFLRGGALGYIGSVWEIHDAVAAEFATDFYTSSFEHSIGEALRLAKVNAFYKNNVAWLCFILFGDPTLRLI
ncbi:MAG: CHAT domain-containing protein [Theionarchaea archaeon]|nr:CHAT domain-containing protein [Theionarchaea archaeon]